MSEYSEFIVKAMKYIDEKIQGIDHRSIDRQRLHSDINTALVANVNKLIMLDPEEQKKAVDCIFMTQLNKEILKYVYNK